MRHLDVEKGKAHNYALSLERRVESSPFITPQTDKGPKQTSVVDISRAAVEAAHRRLLTTAYHLAMTPTMPLEHFEVLVKVQKTNGVKLIQGSHDGREAKEYISALTEAIDEKCAVILASANFMSILSDGSQARKTKSDKEMVMIRVERNGLPCYIVASLIEMSKWGGTGAEALKDGIDDVFSSDGAFKMSDDDYREKLVSCTADGASVNFGELSGLLKRFDDERGWIIKIHCANHRIELAMKDAFKSSTFTKIDNYYTTFYNLIRNSGKIKGEIKAAAEALHIQNYTLPKLKGTRFIGHRITAFKVLLDMWPAIIAGLENVEADAKTNSTTRSKVKGLLVKFFRSYELLCRTCAYLDLLEAVGPASKIFEGEGLMIFDVKPTVRESIMALEEIADCEDVDDDITSHLSRFFYNENEENFVVKMKAPGDGRKKVHNQTYSYVDLGHLKKLSTTSITKAFEAKQSMSSEIKAMLRRRFNNSFGEEVIAAMRWFDIKNWED